MPTAKSGENSPRSTNGHVPNYADGAQRDIDLERLLYDPEYRSGIQAAMAESSRKARPSNPRVKRRS